MSNTEAVNFKVSTMNDNTIPCKLKYLTLRELLSWIDNQPLDNKIKELLKQSASNCPQKALEHWHKNYLHHLGVAQKKIRATTPIIQSTVIVEEEQKQENLENTMPLENDFD